ncbi:MAG: hypothetical protein V2L15_05420 [Desulfobacteraceae bacterium]|jgi:hypothetical protein|nr:hypothetical protein [Desulfobacteraceae bacterium]
MKIQIETDLEKECQVRISIDGREIRVIPIGDREPLIVGKTSGNNTLGDILADFFQNWAPGIAAAERAVRANSPASTWEPLTETVYEKADDALFFA